MKTIDEYYNKFNEDKRLKTRRGIVEYTISNNYIHRYINKSSKILDLGAGTGAYTIPLFDEGYDVTAVELVRHNLSYIKQYNDHIKAYEGNAINLTMFSDNTFDLIIMFGPMYHLKNEKEQVKALTEAKRVIKEKGIIMIAYCMNEYALITHALKELNLTSSIEKNMIDSNFHITSEGNDLYHYVRIEDINHLNELTGLKRVKIISPDGPSSYIKEYLNKMNDSDFNKFIKYQLHMCERQDLIGAGTHVIDIVTK